MKRLLELLKYFPRASRLPFLAGSLTPAALGISLAYRETGLFNLAALLLTLAGVTGAHLSVNLFNDYFDWLYEVDTAHPPRPLSGGSQVIQEGLETPAEIRIQALCCAAVAISSALGLTFINSNIIMLLFASAGGILGYFYSARPLLLSWRGLGELSTGLCFGPLVVTGSYYGQAGFISPASLFLSLVPGALVSALLYINQYPDYHDDRLAGKKTLVVRLGLQPSLFLLYLFLAAGFIPLLPWPWSFLTPASTPALAGFAPATAAAASLTLKKGNCNPDNKPGKLMFISYTLTLSLMVAGIFIL